MRMRKKEENYVQKKAIQRKQNPKEGLEIMTSRDKENKASALNVT